MDIKQQEDLPSCQDHTLLNGQPRKVEALAEKVNAVIVQSSCGR